MVPVEMDASAHGQHDPVVSTLPEDAHFAETPVLTGCEVRSTPGNLYPGADVWSSCHWNVRRRSAISSCIYSLR